MDAAKLSAGLRILAVDDDRINLVLLKRMLEFCNYNNVTTVTDASTALDMLRARKDMEDQFDLIISDVFMPDGINGFKLLELVSLEMDIPVIMLSANDEMETMVTGLKNGACDYLVKPVHLEHVRNLWMHVVRKNSRNKISNVNDDDGHKLQYGDADNAEKDGANHTWKNSKKSKKVRDDADKDQDKLTQKKQRIHWSGQLQRKFVEAISQIGMDKAVPKKILEVMNVDNLSRENVASHLQKYRMYLRKLNEGTLSHSNRFWGEQPWLNGGPHANSNMSIPENRQEFGRCKTSPILVGASSSSNPFARMDSLSGSETHNVLPTQIVQLRSPRRNLLGIPLQDMDPIGSGGELPKDIVPKPGFSHQVQTFGTNTPMVGLSEQTSMTIFDFGSNKISTVMPTSSSALGSSSSTRSGLWCNWQSLRCNSIMLTQIPNGCGATGSLSEVSTIGQQAIGDQENNNGLLVGTSEPQISNSVMPIQMPNGGGATGNLTEGGNNDPHPIGDQVNSTNELPTGTSEAPIEVINEIDAFVAEWVRQDLLNNSDAFLNGNMEFAP